MLGGRLDVPVRTSWLWFASFLCLVGFGFVGPAAKPAPASILGPDHPHDGNGSVWWQGKEGVCHLEPNSATGGSSWAGNPSGTSFWECRTDSGRYLANPIGGFFGPPSASASVPVGSIVTFRKFDLERGSGNPPATYSRNLTRVRLDVGVDGVFEYDNSGPWVTGEDAAGCCPAFSYRRQLIEFSHRFDSIGDVPIHVIANYSNGSSETASATIPVVADAATASLSASPGLVLTGQPVTFDASSSSALGTIVKYEWDLDGDGVFEVAGDPQRITSFSTRGTKTVGVRVTSRGGATSSTTASVEVRPAAPTADTGVSINNGAQFTNDPNVQVSLSWLPFSTGARISNDGGFAGAQDRPLEDEVSWKLDSSGPERLPKTIYVRFKGAADETKTFQDDIILDETPPKVSNASLAPTAASAAAKARPYRLNVKASDKTSGVAFAQAASDKKKPLMAQKYASKLSVKAKARPKWIRVQDRAGNWSSWKKLK